jgi:S1-C subfamily serine protease
VTLAPRRRRPAQVALVLALLVAFPVLEAGSPAFATPSSRTPAASKGVHPVAAPTSDVLVTLSNLLARLLPSLSPAAPGVAPSLTSQVVASTVRVNGVACGVRLAGSGFSTAPDTVVTNAHVVAGETTTSVLRPDGRTLPATVQAFDPDRDLAVLSVPGLGEPSLALTPAAVGETDAIFGHPLGQAAITVTSARITRRLSIDIGNIYNESSGIRQILVMNTVLQPGDSGSPVVNSAGNVVGVAFASYSLASSTAFAVASEELAQVMAQPRSGAVSTGPCLDEG